MNENLLITQDISVKEALKRLNSTGKRVLIVVDDRKKLLGTLTDGDLRRHILDGKDLNDPVSLIYCRDPFSIREDNYDESAVKEILLKKKIELLPVLDSEGKVVDYVSWNMVFAESHNIGFQKWKIDLPVVIMAGGKGERLAPFTKILPKPLIPVKEKPIIEIIMENFKALGAGKFYLTINYKSEMITAYFNGIDHDYDIDFIREDQYLGSAGGLKILNDKIGTTLLSVTATSW